MSRGLQLDVSDELFQRLERRAEEIGRPLEEIANSWLEFASKREADPLRRLFGTIHSDLPWAEKHDEYLGQELLNDHEPTDEDDHGA